MKNLNGWMRLWCIYAALVLIVGMWWGLERDLRVEWPGQWPTPEDTLYALDGTPSYPYSHCIAGTSIRTRPALVDGHSFDEYVKGEVFYTVLACASAKSALQKLLITIGLIIAPFGLIAIKRWVMAGFLKDRI